MELKAPNSDTIVNNAENPHLDPNNVGFFGSSHDDLDSSCSTPYVSAPSSPGRCGGIGGFFYSAPSSPMHFALLSISKQSSESSQSKASSSEFEFSARFGSSGSGSTGSMSSADELFLNGKIRPMKLSSHLERPQVLAPLLDLEVEEDEDEDWEAERLGRGRDSRLRNRSLRRRTRSMSPLRSASFQCLEDESVGDGASCSAHEESRKDSNGSPKNGEDGGESFKAEETTPCDSASSSRSSSAGRSSKRWVFLKDFLRSKSEGRSNNKFWSTISFSPAGKEKKPTNPNLESSVSREKFLKFPPPEPTYKAKTAATPASGKKPANGLGKRRVPLSAHELHYTANRAQAEELRKKTYLPYRQGLFGCLGFSSKSYGAINGFARALNPVSSR